MIIVIFCCGVAFGLFCGVGLGAQIIDERNRELKYLRKGLSKAAVAVREEDLFIEVLFSYKYTPFCKRSFIMLFSVAVAEKLSTALVATVKPV